MARYREHPRSIDRYIADTTQRIARIEKTPRSAAAGVNRGSLVFNGGQLSVQPGEISIDSDGFPSGFPTFFSTSLPRAIDTFYVSDDLNRTVASGFGSASFFGQPWSVVGTAADYNVSGGIATVSLGAVNTRRSATIGTPISSTLIRSPIMTIPAVATGAPIAIGLLSRYQDTSNFYNFEILFNTDQTVTYNIIIRLAGTNNTLASVTAPWTYTAGTQFRMVMLSDGNQISAKAWPISIGEPGAYQIAVTDLNFDNGANGVTMILKTGNTNTTPVVIPMNTQLVNETKFRVLVYNDITGVGFLNPVNRVEISRALSPNAFGIPAFSFNDAPIDPTIPVSSLHMTDKWGCQIFSDAPLGRGLRDPKLTVPFFDSSATKSTTSATFVNFMSTFWQMYHPYLRVRILINVPAATTYEIRINEPTGNGVQALTSVTASFTYVDLTVTRDSTADLGSGVNGNEMNLDLEWRRTAGAGTATMAFVYAIGLDIDGF